MNIDLVGKIRPSLRAEAENIIVEGQRVAANPRGPYLNFLQLYRKDASNLDIYRNHVENLLDLYIAGFNVCLLVMGESGSGKTYTIAGEGTAKNGLVPMIFDALFSKLAGERYMQDTKVRRQNPQVELEMYEVYNELIKDLLQVPSGATGAFLELGETAEKGVHIKIIGDNPQPTRTCFTIVELPGLEKLSDDPNHLRQKEGPALSKALIALNQVVTSLSSNPFPDRVISYGDSKLTQLLRDELGGNCKTRGILCLKPQIDPAVLTSVLQFSTRVTQVKNFPVVNDSYAQHLLTQYRAQIIDLRQQSGIGPAPMARVTNVGDIKETIRQLETENLRLRDDNERLRSRMESMQSKFGNIANTKTDLSQQLLLTEEEKLKISQSLVEMQIENNKIREEAEATKFELTNKILILENELMEAQAEKDKNSRTARNAKDRLAEMEKDRKDLADEYVVLKTNYLAMVREHEKETKRNEDLSVELLNLVNAKAALMKQINAMVDGEPSASMGDPDAEVSRVKALVMQNSSRNIRTEDITGTDKDRESVERALFANRKRFEGEMDRIRKEHGDDRIRLETKVETMQKELTEARNLARERQHKIAELNASLIMVRGDKEQLEMQFNRLQHKVKDIGEDFRSRLVKYVEDISEYIDKGSGVPDAKREKRLRQYVDQMLKDMTLSHKEREEQLSHAAQQYRDAKRDIAHKYEELLVAYRNLRLTCEMRGIDPVDMGPDEHHFKLNDQEINSAHLKEISRLKNELTSLRSELDSIKLKFGIGDDDYKNLKPGEKSLETWAAVRKQLREFTLNTQQQLEDERTRLMSENEVLKEQLRESQNYIDIHLARYKQEVVKLRRLLGYDEDGGVVAVTDRNTKSKSRRH
ncbi:hypothetical protein ACJMK2_040707 [Sinanodonta woodiana]|uniref:Kinesin motor domain-containing protein n=1 Tax=Sinanodonta woodiana TaxID=1069815 RepID=A0ABD3W1V1_SINWO